MFSLHIIFYLVHGIIIDEVSMQNRAVLEFVDRIFKQLLHPGSPLQEFPFAGKVSVYILLLLLSLGRNHHWRLETIASGGCWRICIGSNMRFSQEFATFPLFSNTPIDLQSAIVARARTIPSMVETRWHWPFEWT